LPASARRRHGFARHSREHAQHVALAVGEMDHLLAAPQFATSKVKHEIAEAHRLDRRRRRHDGAAEDAGDAQRKLRGSNGFGT